ncbi:hypothetical protein TNCV_3773491 [Trichonephila clavipes]|nr:hypothetical protein TNCV_3773491 [Trichonephila clavipes]
MPDIIGVTSAHLGLYWEDIHDNPLLLSDFIKVNGFTDLHRTKTFPAMDCGVNLNPFDVSYLQCEQVSFSASFKSPSVSPTVSVNNFT